ncbi:MAG: ABC transporter permease [Acidobacteriaceae bacterium]
MNRMIVANLVHRPVRSLISILAIAIEVTLILLIVGLSLGMLNDARGRQAGIGFDLMVQPPGSTMFSGLSGAPVSLKVGDKLKQVPGVTAVAPVVMQVASSTNLEVLYGIDLQSFESVAGPFHFLAGGPFTGPDDAIVDDYYAASKHAKIGDNLDALNHKFRVCGIVEHGKGGRKFFPMATIQDLIGAEGKASIFYLKLQDPKSADQTAEKIKQIPGMSDYVIRSLNEYLSQMTPEHLPGFTIFLNVVIGVAMVIGFIVIFQSMYTAVIERTREIGILKSLGASKGYIVNVILRETLLLCVVGIVVGVLISFVARTALVHQYPTLRLSGTFEGYWPFKAAGIALVGAAIGAVYPSFRAAQKDPIDALAYE